MSENNQNTNRRRRWMSILAAVVVLAGAGYGAYWFMFERQFEKTEDAYIAGDIVPVTSYENGIVLAIHADSTQSVSRGQLLIELDPARAKVAVDGKMADLAKTVRSVRGKFARVEENKAQIAAAQVTLAQAESDLRRRTAAKESVSQEDLHHAQDAVTAAQARIKVAETGLQQGLAEVEGTKISDNPAVMAAVADLRQASIVLGHMKLVAPTSGVVGQRTVQVGQQIAAGTPLMAVVPVDSVWVEANFKEGQLENMRVGQPVEVKADVYGGDVVFHGKIGGFSAGSGSAFALLPPQNASGNWIKIVQRVPVRVLLDPKELREHPLRIGLSTSVRIDVSNTSGAPLAAPTANHEMRGDPGSEGLPETEQVIARILEENGG